MTAGKRKQQSFGRWKRLDEWLPTQQRRECWNAVAWRAGKPSGRWHGWAESQKGLGMGGSRHLWRSIQAGLRDHPRSRGPGPLRSQQSKVAIPSHRLGDVFSGVTEAEKCCTQGLQTESGRKAPKGKQKDSKKRRRKAHLRVRHPLEPCSLGSSQTPQPGFNPQQDAVGFFFGETDQPHKTDKVDDASRSLQQNWRFWSPENLQSDVSVSLLNENRDKFQTFGKVRDYNKWEWGRISELIMRKT